MLETAHAGGPSRSLLPLGFLLEPWKSGLLLPAARSILTEPQPEPPMDMFQEPPGPRSVLENRLQVHLLCPYPGLRPMPVSILGKTLCYGFYFSHQQPMNSSTLWTPTTSDTNRGAYNPTYPDTNDPALAQTPQSHRSAPLPMPPDPR